MKWTLIIILTLGLFGCHNLTDKKSPDKQIESYLTPDSNIPNAEDITKDSLDHIDSIAIEKDKGQTIKFTESEIENFRKSIDQLKAENKLEKIFYPNMTVWGGLDGYYLDKDLVLIEATHQAELGFSSKIFYINQQNFVKIVYREHFAEWGKYEEKYPSKKFEFDASNMTYSDTLYTIILTNPVIFKKQTDYKAISTEVNQTLITKLVREGKKMKKLLNKIKPNR